VDAEANKRLVLRFYDEVWAHGNTAFAHEVFADDYMRHDLRPTQAEPGAGGQAKIAAQFREAFPDLRWRIDLVLAEDDRLRRDGQHLEPRQGVGLARRQAASTPSSPA
jgi:predicted SnoaL-like aldol condensation-catalyzing enzyme